MAISPNAFSNVIDCDIHPTVPSLNALLPYMNEDWNDTIVQRGVHDQKASIGSLRNEHSGP